MDISHKSPYIKVANFFRFITNRLVNNSYVEDGFIREGDRIDICTLARRLLIWGPLVAGIYAIFYYYIVWTMIIYPLTNFSGLEFLVGYGLPLAFAATVAGIFVAIIAFSVGAGAAVVYAKEKIVAAKEGGNVFVNWLYSIKDKTCVLINVKEKTNG